MTLESLEEDAIDIYKRGGLKDLEDIPGVGKVSPKRSRNSF